LQSSLEGDRGDIRKITYKELSQEVNRFANLLKEDFGVKKGDRVVLYMPMIPESAFAMLGLCKNWSNPLCCIWWL